MLEIERKYQVKSNTYKSVAFASYAIAQGYLNSHPERTTRIRIKNQQAFLTIKGKGSADGTTRFEWEKEIAVDDARQLLRLCEPGIIEKNRYLVQQEKHVIEVDEFLGDNEGLVIAEIELNEASEQVQLPDWLGKEVTGETRYYNASLSKNPYKNWSI